MVGRVCGLVNTINGGVLCCDVYCSQLEAIYGQACATSIRSCFRNLIVLGGAASDPATAKEMSLGLGECEVERIHLTKTKTGTGTTFTESIQHSREIVLMPSEIVNLPDMEGFIKFAGNYPIGRIRRHSPLTYQTNLHLPDSRLNKTSLDEYYVIEIAILNWAINTKQPLLLAFIAIDNRFRWTRSQAFSVRDFEYGELHRLQNLRHLATVYVTAVNGKDTNLNTQTDIPWLPILSRSQFLERKKWILLCEKFGYQALNGYFKTPPKTKFPVLLESILIAFIVGALGWIFNSNTGGITPYIISIGLFWVALGFNVFVGPFIARRSSLSLSPQLLFVVIGVLLVICFLNDR